jgi:hypothetical protein
MRAGRASKTWNETEFEFLHWHRDLSQQKTENLFSRNNGAGYYAACTGGRMDFIERIFGFSPDNGDGSLEFFCIVALAVIAFLVGIEIYLRRKRRSSSCVSIPACIAARPQPSDGESHLQG